MLAKGVSKAVLAGIAAVACLSVLIVGAASSRLQGPADLLATNAVEQARAQLQEAANSNDLTALDAAIAHGESVLKTINGEGAARTQSLAEVSDSDVQKWRAEAEQAAAKVEKLEGVQARARAAAQMAKIDEEEWLHRAREARSKATQLAERKETEVDSLQSEKRKLKERLIANEKKIKRVEEEQRMVEQPAPELDVPREPTSTLRQMFREGGRDPRFGGGDGSSGDSDRKVQGLEAELQRQIREYREARESVSENAHEAQEHAKEKHLMDEINHIKEARIALIENKKWSHTTTRPASRSSRLSRHEQEKARLLAQESKINKEIANLDGNGDNDHAVVYGHDGRKVDNEVSRALQDQEELPDFVSIGDRGSSKLAKQQAGGHLKHESVLQGFENALGDSKESAKRVMHSTGSVTKKAKLQHGHSLPGVNAYSWWSEKSEKVAAKKAQLADIRRRIRSETHRAAKTNCHNLYSCVGSMFTGEEDSPKLANANKIMLHRKQQELARAQANKGKKGGSKLAALDEDNSVSTKKILQDPQAPLLGLLQGSSKEHTNKLPGVVDNRWDGNKFWDRLLGAPAKQGGVPLKHVHQQKAADSSLWKVI